MAGYASAIYRSLMIRPSLFFSRQVLKLHKYYDEIVFVWPVTFSCRYDGSHPFSDGVPRAQFHRSFKGEEKRWPRRMKGFAMVIFQRYLQVRAAGTPRMLAVSTRCSYMYHVSLARIDVNSYRSFNGTVPKCRVLPANPGSDVCSCM